MKRQKISGIYADAASFDGQSMTVCGWVRTVRDMKNFGFIELNDGSCFKSLQVVLSAASLKIMTKSPTRTSAPPSSCTAR